MISLLLCILAFSAAGDMPVYPSSWRAGIYAVDAETGEVLMDINGSGYFRPASTVKLVTTLVAMRELGPSYVYRTRMLADTIGRDLYIVGAGAPLLSAEHVRIISLETSAAVQPSSSWRLHWDTSRFRSEPHLPGWDVSDWSKTYCPPIEALSIGDNIVQLIVSTVSDTIRVFHYPPLPNLEIENSLTTGATESVQVSVRGWEENSPRLILQGTVPADTHTIIYKPFAGPPAEFAGLLSAELENAGLEITEVLPGQAPDSIPLFRTSVIYSDPMFVLLASMNKWSRNMVADMIMRTVSLETGSTPASTSAGCDVAGRLLAELEPELTDFQLADGSGLSRFNSLTPRHLAAVVLQGAGSPEWGVEFLATLPVNGVDGTLSSRISDLPPGAFRGKTGSLSDTSTIAGILRTSSEREIVLVIMFEVPFGHLIRARNLQDSIISWFWENY